MHQTCYLAAAHCQLVLKFLPHSPVVGVWWVNPQRPEQCLHLGQYHLQKDAWYDVSRASGSAYCSDEVWQTRRRAIPLPTQHWAAARAAIQSITNQAAA